MKKTFIDYYIIFLLIIFFISCSKKFSYQNIPDIYDNYWTFPTQINVSINNKSSRVTYDDEDTLGVKQYWETDDKFILYNTNGDTVSYIISNIETANKALATFNLVGTEPLSGATFYAVYQNGRKVTVDFSNDTPTFNFVMTGQTQNSADPMGNLKGYDLIVSGPIISLNQTFAFESQGALFTFNLMIPANSGDINNITISATDTIEYFFKTNYINTTYNASTYNLAITGYYNPTDSYTLKAYMMIPPFSLTAGTTFNIKLTTTKTILTYSYKFNNTKNYLAAVRYNFDVTNYTTNMETANYTEAMENLRNDSDWMDNKPTEGDGSSSNPYIISDGWKLGWLKALVYNDNTNTQYNAKNVNYKLTTNIAIADSVQWTPIGDNNTVFSGNFDGDGNTISNMTINKSSNGNQALFGSTSDTYIYNLTVSGNITPNGGSTYGGIIGYALNSTVANCNSYVSISPISGFQGQCGGIIGAGKGTIIINKCNNYGKVISSNPVGGIIGLYQDNNGEPNITDCTNYGIVEGSENVGGIIGNADSKITITGCINNGNVSASGYGKAAGIVGIGINSPISDCTNNGEITGENMIEQIIGENNGSSCTLSNNTENGSIVISN